jgi:hypothetical protein
MCLVTTVLLSSLAAFALVPSGAIVLLKNKGLKFISHARPTPYQAPFAARY